MGLGDMAKKAKEALGSEKGEEVSDQVLDKGADLADRATGGKYADKIERGRDAVDERVGNEGARGDTTVTDAQTGATTTDADESAAGRHRGDGAPDAGGSDSPGERKHRG